MKKEQRKSRKRAERKIRERAEKEQIKRTAKGQRKHTDSERAAKRYLLLVNIALLCDSHGFQASLYTVLGKKYAKFDYLEVNL